MLSYNNVGVIHSFSSWSLITRCVQVRLGKVIWFKSISNLNGYLMPNPVYAHTHIYRERETLLANIQLIAGEIRESIPFPRLLVQSELKSSTAPRTRLLRDWSPAL